MTDSQKPTPQELYESELRAATLRKAQVDLEIAEKDRDLKKLEIEEKTSWGSYIRVVTTNPAFLAAVVTACITAAITLNSEKQSKLQMEAEKVRFAQDKDKSILLGITNNLEDPDLIASKLKLFLDTGILEDDAKGTFRTTQHNLEKEFQQKIVSNILSASEDLPLDFGRAPTLNTLLRPTNLHTLNYFIQQGFSPELLYWLFVNVITEIRPLPYHLIAAPAQDQSSDAPDNESGDSSHDETQPNETNATPENRSGAQQGDTANSQPPQTDTAQPNGDKERSHDTDDASQEEQAREKPVLAYEYIPANPAISCNTRRQEQVCFADFIKLFVLMGLTVEERRVENPQGGSDIGRLCFDQTLAERAQRIIPPEKRPSIASTRLLDAVQRSVVQPKCGVPWRLPENGASDSLVFAIASSAFKIQLRSTYTAFRFLGQLVASSAKGNPIVLSDTGEQLLTITNSPNNQCFVTSEFQGQTYCVPNDARPTKQIIELLGDSLKLSR